MKERNKRFLAQKAKDDAIMDFVSRQAQEAILDPDLPESYKEAALEAALEVILRIAKKRSEYIANPSESQKFLPSNWRGQSIDVRRNSLELSSYPEHQLISLHRISRCYFPYHLHLIAVPKNPPGNQIEEKINIFVFTCCHK